MRAFSIRCFQNSKRFERDFRDEFLRIAQQHDFELRDLCQHQEMGWRDKLAYLGIYARPESYELSGAFSIITSTGTVDCSAFYPYGLAILSSAVDNIQGFEFSNIQKVVFIENSIQEILEGEFWIIYSKYVRKGVPFNLSALYWDSSDKEWNNMDALRKMVAKIKAPKRWWKKLAGKTEIYEIFNWTSYDRIVK